MNLVIFVLKPDRITGRKIYIWKLSSFVFTFITISFTTIENLALDSVFFNFHTERFRAEL